MDSPEVDSASPKTIEDYLRLSLIKIKKYFKRVDTNNFSISIKGDFEKEVDALSDLDKAFQIYNYVTQSVKEKKRFFDTAKYEYINLDENFDKLKYKSGFNQANFTDLIEKCKMLMKCQQDDNLYIERLKQEIIILNSQKNAIIEKTTDTINTMKKNQLDLIDKITKLNENCQLIDQGKQELMIKQQQLQERTQENLMLKKDLKKVKQGFDREKTSIIIGKDKQIEYLQTKLRSAEKYQFNEEKEKKEKFKYLNMYKEMKLEIQTLLTENNRLACEVAKLTARDYAINQNYKKLESALVNARKTIQFLVNTPAFKEVKKMFFNMENVDMLTSVGNEINTSKENGYLNTNSSVDVK